MDNKIIGLWAGAGIQCLASGTNALVYFCLDQWLVVRGCVFVQVCSGVLFNCMSFVIIYGCIYINMYVWIYVYMLLCYVLLTWVCFTKQV